MEPENIIKGRIAEAIIEELLRTSGNKVYRFGYESILQNLIQTDSDLIGTAVTVNKLGQFRTSL